MKKKTKIPTYGNGGKNFVDFSRNLGLTIADTALSGVGAGNAIGEDMYRGKSAESFKKISNTGGAITKSVVPVAGAIGGAVLGTAIGNPMLGAQLGYGAAKGIQGVGGSLSPEDATGGSEGYMQSQRQGQRITQAGDQLGMFAAPLAGTLAPMLMNKSGNNNQMLAGGADNFQGASNDMMYAANGGMNIQPNAEVEGGENTIAPNGQYTQYEGPSHEQGGIPTQLDPGEIVFSDRLKPKGSKKTFAELNKSFNTNKEDKITEDVKTNNLKKLTADLMKQAKIKQSIALFQEQEALKQSKLDNYAKRLGVSNYKFGGGGKFDGDNDPALKDEFGRDGYLNNQSNPNYSYLQGDKYTMEDIDNPDPVFKNPGYPKTPPSTLKNPNKYAALAQLGIGLAQNAGNLYDLNRAKTVDKEVYNTYTPQLLNYNPALQYNNMQGKMAQQNIREASNGNSATYLNNMKDQSINQMMANANIRMGYQNQNAQIQNQAGLYNTSVADKNMLAKLQNEAASRNIKGNAINNIGGNVTNQYQNYLVDKNKQSRDSDYLKIIATKYPEIMKDPELAKLFTK